MCQWLSFKGPARDLKAPTGQKGYSKQINTQILIMCILFTQGCDVTSTSADVLQKIPFSIPFYDNKYQ